MCKVCVLGKDERKMIDRVYSVRVAPYMKAGLGRSVNQAGVAVGPPLPDM